MGGDHKCPVCQATFTRPQHVARHMRSHTGDRPYKCQCCGDQFARSDLLSRHVNKCHPNEKPAANATTTRRKGSASASRATTSKQACDQCVQSSLPCDGCNPCSKCVQRKCRCTYVKFHRQTAPSGPGHHNPRPASASSLSGTARLPSHLDEFILGPPPVSVPSMSGAGSTDPLFSTPFSFNSAYPQPSATDLGALSLSMSSDTDMTGKFRHQAELLRRAGTSMLSNPSGAVGVIPGLYTGASQQPATTNWLGWNDNDPQHGNDTHARYEEMNDKELQAALSRYGSGSEQYHTGDMFSGNGNMVGSAYRPRSGSVNLSDSSSVTSQSVPSSAASSNVHLPLTGDIYQSGSEDYQHQFDGHRRRGSMPASQAEHFQQQPEQRLGEGGFSSAFGLMSIDDPNVLAGLSTDGVPFFSSAAMNLPPHSPNATPMPPKQQHVNQHNNNHRDRGLSLSAVPLPTPGANRDAETRELRDFWRAYMRTPLSGSGPNSLDISGGLMPQSPNQRRRVRVSSLPSVKTPTVERGHPMHPNGNHAEGTSGMRTTLHGNPEDLRSYEAAVNARHAALNLNLVPRKKASRPSTSSASPPVQHSNSAGGAVRGTVPNSAHVEFNVSRPSSSSSASSLAHAFGSQMKPPPMNGVSISLPVPANMGLSGAEFPPGSRESSVASDGTGSSDGDFIRPSFKRLPSQTLGPANAKRTQLERGDEVKSESIDSIINGDRAMGQRPIAGLPERVRQASDKVGLDG
ncbi:hypothetical protein BJ138DRAFT_1008683 [Hygrophoropsis aurantiaca]|uniref:Uncharacterized protein n=1 Tax=Hygrophoropsis aurantiaca TaxID=72124 RepID=A0ACB8ABL9_9AGAM|nr:hypothetical protein BJ138DRAFT_1008683 [Hygrophoropsis aurantiaca]